MYEEIEDKGKRQFEALPSTKKIDLDKHSFVEGFIYGVINESQETLSRKYKSKEAKK